MFLERSDIKVESRFQAKKDIKCLILKDSIDQVMKKFKQKVFDGFSTSQASSGGSSVNKNEIEIPEVLGSANFELKKVKHFRSNFKKMIEFVILDINPSFNLDCSSWFSALAFLSCL